MPLLNRGLIAKTALDEGTAHGIDGVTMRNVARCLGVHVSSLYNHVRSRDDLLDAMRDVIWEKSDTTLFGNAPWQIALRRWSESLFAAHLEHVALVPYLTARPVSSKIILNSYERCAEGLVAAGFSEVRTMMIQAMLDSFIFGAVAEVQREDQAWAFPLDLSEFPVIERLDRYVRNEDIKYVELGFRSGLDMLLNGFASELATAGR